MRNFLDKIELAHRLVFEITGFACGFAFLAKLFFYHEIPFVTRFIDFASSLSK